MTNPKDGKSMDWRPPVPPENPGNPTSPSIKYMPSINTVCRGRHSNEITITARVWSVIGTGPIGMLIWEQIINSVSKREERVIERAMLNTVPKRL